jgi:hypothetical protein
MNEQEQQNLQDALSNSLRPLYEDIEKRFGQGPLATEIKILLVEAHQKGIDLGIEQAKEVLSKART